MFYKAENGFYINADKIATIEFGEDGFADISFNGNGADDAIPVELAQQIMDDMGCSGFNPYEIEEENEETENKDDVVFYTERLSENIEEEQENEKMFVEEKTLTFFEYAKHAYALGFRYATPLCNNYSEPYVTVFWEKKPVYVEQDKRWELAEGQAVSVHTILRLAGLVDLEGYLFTEEELYV